MTTSTVSAVLERIAGASSPPRARGPIRRYERSRPGELIQIDVKKLGRIGPHGAGHRVLGRSWAKEGRTRTDAEGVLRRLQTGWERVHACIDDATRLAYWSCPTRRPPPRSASCGGRLPSTAPTASSSSD